MVAVGKIRIDAGECPQSHNLTSETDRYLTDGIAGLSRDGIGLEFVNLRRPALQALAILIIIGSVNA